MLIPEPNAPASAGAPDDSGHPRSAIPACVPAAMRRGSLLPLENEDEYDVILEAFAQEMRPQNLMEFLLVKDAADAAWEQIRLRALRDAHLAASGARAARLVINEISPGNCHELTLSDIYRSARMDKFHAGWLTGDEEQCQLVEALLEDAGTTENAFYGRGLADEIDIHVKIDRMINARMQTRQRAPKDLQQLKDCARSAESGAGAAVTPDPDEARVTRH